MDIDEIKKVRRKNYTDLLKYTSPKFNGEIPETLLSDMNKAHIKLIEINNIHWIDKISEFVPDPLVKLGTGRIVRISEL